MENADPAGLNPPETPRGRKRTFRQMTGNTEEAAPSLLHSLQPGSSSQNTDPPRILPPPPRFPGDGLDFRRPLMSTGPFPPRPSLGSTPSNFIDLTEDAESPAASSNPVQRRIARHRSSRRSIPRRMPATQNEGTPDRPISVSGARDRTGRSRSNSPEVHFLYERNVERGQRTTSHAPEVVRRMPSVPSSLRQGSLGPLRSTRSPSNGWSSWLTLGGAFRYIDAIRMRTDPSLYSRGGQRRQHGTPQSPESHFHAFFESVGFEAPHMNFEAAAFPLNPAPPAPNYEKPSPPREGFVRSPEEADVLICPNCNDELGAGDDDQKRQVWVVKACGHVYCGLCAKNRSKRGKTRDPSLPLPFSKCVVDGCEKTKVSHHKAMFQLYVS